MAKRKRRAFTKAFKAQAVGIVRESGKPVGTVAREGRGAHRREPEGVWEPRNPRETGRRGLPPEPQAGGAIDARPRPGGPPPASLPGDDAVPPPVSHCPQHLGTAIRPGPAGPG